MHQTKIPKLSPLTTTLSPLAILLPPLSASTSTCLQGATANPCTSNLISEAINLAEALGEQAGLCYMRNFFP